MPIRFAAVTLALALLVLGVSVAWLRPAALDVWDQLAAAPPMAMPPAAEPLRADLRVIWQSQLPAGLQPLPWQAEGRVLPDTAGPGLRHEWPGMALVAGFTGDQLAIAYDDPENRFRLLVDDRPAALITRPGSQVVVVSGLGAGLHRLRLERLSEAAGPHRIVGLYAPGPGASPPLPPRRIDFFGDSDTVGYGNTHEGRACPGHDIFLSTDTTQSYPARVARHFAARAEVVAQSGIGMIRNFGGVFPDRTMVRLYDRQLPSVAQTARGDQGKPWLRVIEVGANDFATPLTPEEPWADDAALSADFIAAYDLFVQDLLAEAPEVPIILLDVADAGAEPVAEIASVMQALAAKGAPVSLVALHDLGRTGCDWHPSLADHDRMAQAVIAEIDRLVAAGQLELP